MATANAIASPSEPAFHLISQLFSHARRSFKAANVAVAWWWYIPSDTSLAVI